MKTISFFCVLLSIAFVSCTQDKMADLYSLEVAYKYAKECNSIDTIKYRKEFKEAFLNLSDTEKTTYPLYRDSINKAVFNELEALKRDEQKAMNFLHE